MLEIALNNRDEKSLNKIFSPEVSSQIKLEYNNFLKRFHNAEWEIFPSKENENLFKVFIKGKHKSGSHTYDMQTEQTLYLKQDKDRIIKHEVLSEYSILNESENNLEVQVEIPDKVLTGTKYNVDIIVKKPLSNSMIAGGLIHLNQDKYRKDLNSFINLSPLGSGGIFKIVQAPLTPGSQTLAALIAHPDGLIAITKKVQVVSEY
tara:strand:+ start:567 stop:1181 length:615 start_codon:yes stop_codon:yes gene_type:complete